MNTAGGLLQARDLLLRFPGQEHPLFDIPALDVRAGGSLGIRGPSGAGKTTLFHCLSGIARPTTGKIFWNATAIGGLTAGRGDRWRHRNLGLVFQDFHLVDGLSALDNVLLPASFNHWRLAPALRQRALDLLTTVNITAVTRKAALLSRGERQRVALPACHA